MARKMVKSSQRLKEERQWRSDHESDKQSSSRYALQLTSEVSVNRDYSGRTTPVVPLESDCRDPITTEDPLGKSHPTEEGENRCSNPKENGTGTGKTGCGDERPEQQMQGMTTPSRLRQDDTGCSGEERNSTKGEGIR